MAAFGILPNHSLVLDLRFTVLPERLRAGLNPLRRPARKRLLPEEKAKKYAATLNEQQRKTYV
ncbi:hypothetical protein C7120_05265 [Prevotella sp. oral taxon 376]|nr:hypothetical protein C7120_05265 [Prevotella sp. oral taxon 376]